MQKSHDIFSCRPWERGARQMKLDERRWLACRSLGIGRGEGKLPSYRGGTFGINREHLTMNPKCAMAFSAQSTLADQGKKTLFTLNVHLNLPDGRLRCRILIILPQT
jgi:hypothetical protein